MMSTKYPAGVQEELQKQSLLKEVENGVRRANYLYCRI